MDTISDKPETTSKTDSFEELYLENRAAIYAYVQGMIHDAAGAEDITSSVFEKAWKRRGLLRFQEARPWLFKVARNASLDELRRRKRQAIPGENIGDYEDLVSNDPAETLWLKEHLERLPGKERELIILRFWADLDFKEIARILGIKPEAARQRLSRTLTKLKEEIEND